MYVPWDSLKSRIETSQQKGRSDGCLGGKHALQCRQRKKTVCESTSSKWVHSRKITIKGSSLILSQSTERVKIPWAKELVELQDAQGITKGLQMTSHEISCTLNKGIVGQISPELESFQRTHKNCPEAELLHLVTFFSLCRHAVCSALK